MGSEKKCSTELAAIELLDRLLEQLNQKKIPLNFYLDLSKAFEGLNHNIVIDKLAYYCVTGKCKDLLLRARVRVRNIYFENDKHDIEETNTETFMCRSMSATIAFIELHMIKK